MTALPPGASCGASCQHIARCRAEHAVKGSEAACLHEPSQYTPKVQLMPNVLSAQEYNAR